METKNLILIPVPVDEFRGMIVEAVAACLKVNRDSREPAPLPELGGIALAEKVTGYKPSTIYNLVSARQIPHFKRGKRVYFKRSDLEAWITDGKRDTNQEAEEKALERMTQASGRRAAK